MYEFHTDQIRYFEIQDQTTRQYILPFVSAKKRVDPSCRVLDIGCSDGCVLKTFLEIGCTCVGVELDEERVARGKQNLAEYIEKGQLKFIAKDIYQTDPVKEFGGKFDIILMKDVIEHIFDQEKLIQWLKSFLNPGGVIFFGFPPWQMPFGGHQQMCNSKLLSRWPYFHLLPMPLYKWILKKNNECVPEFVDLKRTGISIERFERIARKTGYRILHKRHFFVNPVYQFKFNWKARTQSKVISAIPYFRNFLTTCAYYLIQPE